MIAELSEALEEKITPFSYSINLNVTRWGQSDSRWGSNIMRTCNNTISAVGCAVTSVAMVFNYYGASTNPGTLNAGLGTSACPIYWATAATLYSQVGGVSVNTSPLLSLMNDVPVIVGYTKPDGGTHFVTVKGVFNSGGNLSDFLANDPAGGGVQRYLNYYDNLGWTPHRIVIYSRS